MMERFSGTPAFAYALRGCENNLYEIPETAIAGSIYAFKSSLLGMTLQVCTVNLKGWPTSPQALAGLSTELERARRDGVSLLKIIHGYGSSGEGGVIRDAVQAELVRLARDGQIRAFISGDDWRISNESTWAVVSKHRELKRDRDLGRGNRGISIVLL
jgi:hypothetical protein